MAQSILAEQPADMVSPIDEVLSKREEPEWHKPVIGRYHASQLAYCLRRQYLDFVSPVTEYDSDGARKMWLGSVIHNAIENEILPFTEDSFTPIAVEKPVWYGLPNTRDGMIVGRFDVLLMDPSGELAIMDVKSREDLYYVDKEGPGEHDVRQLAMYQGATRIEKGYLWYVGRRKGDDLFYRQDLKKERFRWMVAQGSLLHQALKLKELPEMCPQYGWEPRYCKHRNRPECENCSLNGGGEQ